MKSRLLSGWHRNIHCWVITTMTLHHLKKNSCTTTFQISSFIHQRWQTLIVQIPNLIHLSREKKFQVNQLQITFSRFSSFIVLIMTVFINIVFILNKILKLQENQNKQGRGGVKTTVVINIHLCALQKITSLVSIFILTGKWETKKFTRIHPKT